MASKQAKLEKVSKYGGVKLSDQPETWVNPTKEFKDSVKERLEKIKGWEGKEVIVDFANDGFYYGIAPADGNTEPDNNVAGKSKSKPEKKGTALLSIEHIIKLQGKDFVTHEGLLEVAHNKGLQSIESMKKSPDDAEQVIFKARVTMKDGGFFEAYGDADNKNTNSMIKMHMLRMAETRAVNRALRFATNIGMCSSEELGGNENAGAADEKPPEKPKEEKVE